jgi:hypothetical protein
MQRIALLFALCSVCTLGCAGQRVRITVSPTQCGPVVTVDFNLYEVKR